MFKHNVNYIFLTTVFLALLIGSRFINHWVLGKVEGVQASRIVVMTVSPNSNSADPVRVPIEHEPRK